MAPAAGCARRCTPALGRSRGQAGFLSEGGHVHEGPNRSQARMQTLKPGHRRSARNKSTQGRNTSRCYSIAGAPGRQRLARDTGRWVSSRSLHSQGRLHGGERV